MKLNLKYIKPFSCLAVEFIEQLWYSVQLPVLIDNLDRENILKSQKNFIEKDLVSFWVFLWGNLPHIILCQ